MPNIGTRAKPQPAAPLTFPPAHLAAALDWPALAGGLVTWKVYVDALEECGTEFVTVAPPMADRVGYDIVRDAAGVVITWAGERQSALDLIDAMQMCCPLAPMDLAEVREAAAAYTTLGITPIS